MAIEVFGSNVSCASVNPLNINLTKDELKFVEDNCFYNLKIQQINKDTIAQIYDEIVALIQFYNDIDAYALVEFATAIEDKLFDFVPWQEIEQKENGGINSASVVVTF